MTGNTFLLTPQNGIQSQLAVELACSSPAENCRYMSRVLQDRQIISQSIRSRFKYLRTYCFQDQQENFSPGVCARLGLHEPCSIVITEVIVRQRLSQSPKITWSMIHGPPRSRRFDDFSQTDRNSSRRSSTFGSVSHPGCMDNIHEYLMLMTMMITLSTSR